MAFTGKAPVHLTTVTAKPMSEEKEGSLISPSVELLTVYRHISETFHSPSKTEPRKCATKRKEERKENVLVVDTARLEMSPLLSTVNYSSALLRNLIPDRRINAVKIREEVCSR